MRIEIDTKEDLHNVRHIIRLLQAISGHSGKDNYRFNDDMFSDSSSPSSSAPNPVSNPDTSASLFNMFGDSSSSSTPSSSSSDSSLGIPSIFSEPKKDEDNKKDFLDSLQVY